MKADTTFVVSSQMPDAALGLALEFEGYELSRASYNQECTQGQWIIQNRRYALFKLVLQVWKVFLSLQS